MSRQLTVTISNTFGNGLCCLGEKNNGHYKLYNGNPMSSNLLVSGGEFDYYEVIQLVIDSSGVIHESNDYFAFLGNADASPAVSSDADNQTNDDAEVTESSFTETDEDIKSSEQSSDLSNKVTDANQSDSDSNAKEFSDWQQQQEQQQQIDAAANAILQNETAADNTKPEITSDISPEASQQQLLQQEEEKETETPLSLQYGDANFDYTNNFRNDLKPTGNDEKTPVKPILISVVCGSLLLGMTLIFIANRRKSLRDFEYYEDENGSSICSDDFIEHDNKEVETSYRVKPIRRRDSSPSRDHSIKIRRASLEDDQSIKSGHSNRSNRSSRSNRSPHSNSPSRRGSLDDDHSIKSGHSARSNTSGRSSRSEINARRYHGTGSTGSISNRNSDQNQDDHSIRSSISRQSARGSVSGRSSHSELNARRNHDISSTGSISRRNSDQCGNTLGDMGSASSESYRRSKSYPTENNINTNANSFGNSTIDDASQGVDTIVQSALDDAISLFEEGSSSTRRGVNHILEKFEEEVDDIDAVFT